MTRITRSRQLAIKKKAREVARETGFLELPVDPAIIAEKKDITLQGWEASKPGLSGFLMIQGGQVGIGYSTAIQNNGFKNFTIAHELGHYHLEGHIDFLIKEDSPCHFSKSGFVSDLKHEREADLFAAELLMPYQLFTKALQEAEKIRGKGFPAISHLAEEANTSIVATALRYAEVSDDPVAVIVSSNQEIEYSWCSPSLLQTVNFRPFQKGNPVARGTITEKFNVDESSIKQGLTAKSTCCFSDWSPESRRIEFNEDVVGLGHYEKVLTVLFSEEAIDSDEEEDEEDSNSGLLPSMRWEQRDRSRRI